ncbi:uncharacterized protein E0L32_005887 [Thyridium curvatum]|uniref:Xylanolytic transcriptional activator regulatory domain-containing protein n=1 Tax=Thyridium curvatum TaxID=1093900 RepID=A0A507B4R9_9PEZI|nr:uncharacterized protein E0L32_005887 [Thyridium curvatum]TPX13684.1 hypothetical protein E0L32_005887 [Thyridium curvatum]
MPRSSSSANSAATGTPTGTPSSQRLPVNPRRHKVAPDQRKRVATANSSRDCQYPVVIDKVSIARSELEELRSKCAALESCLQEAVPDLPRRQLLLSRAGLGSTTPESPASSLNPQGSSVDDDQPPSDGRLLQDFDGTTRYLGETSGATFLDNLKQFMSTIFPLAFNGSQPDNQTAGSSFIATVGRYQTYDSRPLVTPAVDPLWLPPAEEMSAALDQLKYFVQEGGGITGGTIFMGNLTDLPSDPRMPMDQRNMRNIAFFQAALAYASLLHLTTANSKQDGQLGETFFMRAKLLLGNPLDISTYTSTDVAVMAVMGSYLLEVNRRDAGYMYITTALHVALMHGVHRGWSVDEQGKRVFWTIYILDRWISCLMGRPPSILDDAIRLDLPRDAPGLPPSIGLRANVELFKIAGHIVCNTYRIAPWPEASQKPASAHVDTALQMLASWRKDLPPPLQLSYETYSGDRPLCTLHMTYNQLLILTIRPILFMAVKKAVADRFVSRQWDIEDHAHIEHIRECSDAARRNLRLGRWLHTMSPGSKLLLPDLHNIFNAAIILLLHQIVFVNLRTNDVSDIAFSTEVFEREAGFGDRYGEDCARVLQDLSALVRRLRNLMFDGIPRISPHVDDGGRQVGGTASSPPGVLSSGASPSAYGIVTPPPQAVGAGGGGVGAGGGGSNIISIPVHGDGNALYQELMTWLDNDDLQMYNNYLV